MMILSPYVRIQVYEIYSNTVLYSLHSTIIAGHCCREDVYRYIVKIKEGFYSTKAIIIWYSNRDGQYKI